MSYNNNNNNNVLEYVKGQNIMKDVMYMSSVALEELCHV